MGKTAPVEIDLLRSEKIVRELEAAGVRVAVAMWVHFPEYEDWRFVLASKDIDIFSLGDAYLKVNRILTKAGISQWETFPSLS